MTKHAHSIEERLARMQPQPLSEHTRAAIRDALVSVTPEEPVQAVWRPIWALRLAATVAVAVTLGLLIFNTSDDSSNAPVQLAESVSAPSSVAPAARAALPRSSMQPWLVDSVLVSEKDHGMVMTDSGIPVRHVQRSYVDNVHWVDPQSRRVIKTYHPREENVMVKLTTY